MLQISPLQLQMHWSQSHICICKADLYHIQSFGEVYIPKTRHCRYYSVNAYGLNKEHSTETTKWCKLKYHQNAISCYSIQAIWFIYMDACKLLLIMKLTRWGLVTSYGDRDLGFHWQQAITWTNVDLSSVRSSDIHLRVCSQEIPQLSITEIIWKIK